MLFFLQPQRVVSSFVPTLMPRPNQPHWILIFLILNSFSDFSYAQRLVISPTPDPSASDAPAVSANSTLLQENWERTLVLKTYPDGTKKIVPLAALNFRDDGAAFGGPPKLSMYQETAKPPTALSPTSPERLTIVS